MGGADLLPLQASDTHLDSIRSSLSSYKLASDFRSVLFSCLPLSHFQETLTGFVSLFSPQQFFLLIFFHLHFFRAFSSHCLQVTPLLSFLKILSHEIPSSEPLHPDAFTRLTKAADLMIQCSDTSLMARLAVHLPQACCA